jgi:glutaredoxin-like protein NrdH
MGGSTMAQKRVRMYTLSTCSHCKAAKKWMSDHGIEYDYTDVDLLTGEERTDVINDVRRHNPNCTFPTILIGDEVIVGNDEDRLKKALNIEVRGT